MVLNKNRRIDEEGCLLNEISSYFSGQKAEAWEILQNFLERNCPRKPTFQDEDGNRYSYLNDILKKVDRNVYAASLNGSEYTLNHLKSMLGEGQKSSLHSYLSKY